MDKERSLSQFIGSSLAHIDTDPTECPICHTTQTPEFIKGVITADEEIAELAYECVNRDCKRLFIAFYEREDVDSSHFTFLKSLPQEISTLDIPPNVSKVARVFSEYFTQAQKAEASKWSLVAGQGYLKALEVLIKEYTLLNEPDAAKELAKLDLGPVINRYIQNEEIKDCARSASWIGPTSDQCQRSWSDEQLADIKEFIEMCVLWMESDIRIKLMIKSKKRKKA